MKINLISNIYNPVGPSVSGGLEVFNYYLAREFADRSEDVHLYASGDSEKADFLEPIIDQSFSKRGDEFLLQPWNNRRITVEEFAIYTELVQNLSSEKQILHFSMVNFLPIYLSVKRGLKVITTLHMPVTNYHYQVLRKLLTDEEFKRAHFIGISHSQVKSFPGCYDVIHNGVNTEEFSFSEDYRNAFVWIGRIIPEKGAKDAILAASKAKAKLELAGVPRTENEKKHFKEDLEPNFSNLIDYKGFVEKTDRRNFYRGKALIFPPKWEEAFGLTMIESLSSGTPVIAYDRGAVREVISEGENGLIVPVDNIDVLAEAISKINSMPNHEYLEMRKRCRQSVEKNFSLKIMADKYLSAYQRISEEK